MKNQPILQIAVFPSTNVFTIKPPTLIEPSTYISLGHFKLTSRAWKKDKSVTRIFFRKVDRSREKIFLEIQRIQRKNDEKEKCFLLIKVLKRLNIV